MQKSTTIFSLLFTLFVGITGYSQCSSIICPAPITVNNDPGLCSAGVGYVVPVGLDQCLNGTTTYVYSGIIDTFFVPPGVTSINVDVYGAQGGANWVNNDNFGGRVQADVSVTPGDTVYIYVGEQPAGLTGGWNGGGNGESAGAGGGGGSDIRIGGTTYADRIVVAGGAGGAGYWSGLHVVGGFGGGLTGGPGYRDVPATEGGDPGTQTSSGDGTCATFNNPICAGGFGYGGAPSGCGCEGYGGGGGWYGGAGSGNCRGGGGGSGYADASTTSNVMMWDGVRIGHGQIIITWTGSPLPTYLISGLGSGSTFPVGTTTETYFTTNGVDSAMCSFDVVVIDYEVPTITCPLDINTCNSTVTGIEPTSSDNCGAPAVTYYSYGATTITGNDDASGNVFNTGTTMLTYIATDPSGKIDSCTFAINVDPPLPVVLSNFMDSMICIYDSPVALPIGTPGGGTYSGSGVSGNSFDPNASGTGNFYVVYTYTDSTGCSGSDSSLIIVEACSSIDEIGSSGMVTIYPNPSNGIFNLEIDQFDGDMSFEVSSLDGKSIQLETDLTNKSTQIDLSDEPSGVYILRVTLDEHVRMFRMLKE